MMTYWLIIGIRLRFQKSFVITMCQLHGEKQFPGCQARLCGVTTALQLNLSELRGNLWHVYPELYS